MFLALQFGEIFVSENYLNFIMFSNSGELPSWDSLVSAVEKRYKSLKCNLCYKDPHISHTEGFGVVFFFVIKANLYTFVVVVVF